MTTAQLYVVIQEPKQQWRKGVVSFVWFTHATSKAHALRQFLDLCPEAAGPSDRRYYKTPTAQVVTTGGPAIRV